MFLGSEPNSIAAAIFQEPCGHVIPEGDVKQLQKIIRRFLKNPERRQRLGEAARDLFERKYERRQYP
jgi:glycosyltransferase involved in cell wall biosynthesis